MSCWRGCLHELTTSLGPPALSPAVGRGRFSFFPDFIGRTGHKTPPKRTPSPLPQALLPNPPNSPLQAKSSPAKAAENQSSCSCGGRGSADHARHVSAATDRAQTGDNPRDFQPAETPLYPELQTALPACASPERPCS